MMMMMKYMYAPQKWPPHQAKCLRRKAMMMMASIVMILIEITNRTDSSKVDFSDGVPGSRVLQRSNLGPGVVGWVVLEHLQTSKTSHHQSKNSTQYLITDVILVIDPTGYGRLLVQVSSSKTTHRPGKKLLCTEQHLWKVHTSRCICKFCSGTLTVVLLQFDDGLNNYHKYCLDLYNSGNVIA